MQFVFNCLLTGHVCGEAPGDAGYIDCLTTSGEDRVCTNIAATCSTDKKLIEVCDGYYVNEFDCSALGGTCSSAGSIPRCQRPGDSCTPQDLSVNTCQGAGGAIALCVGGRSLQYNCTAAGLGCLGTAGSAHCACAHPDAGSCLP